LSVELIVGSVGTIAAIVALILYVWDKRRIELALIRTYVSVVSPQEYLLQVNVSNEGGREAEKCDVIVEMNGNVVTHLSYAPVDSPLGKIGVDWPDECTFSLYPRRPMWVRGYVKAPPGTRIAVVLRRKGQQVKNIPFTLPDIPAKMPHVEPQ
jgi:hypothetical protein